VNLSYDELLFIGEVVMALRECVDCGKQLGYKADICPNCKSKDPYGSQREMEKLGLIVAIIAIAIFGSSWYFFQLNPLQLLLKIGQIFK
jgi:RNA polymerase subunit RPABC4/transcription elongation factor Spt4